MKNSLKTGETLKTNEILVATNESCFLIMQGDGNLCLYRGSGPSKRGDLIWCPLSKSQPQGIYFAVMQSDGNLVVYQEMPGAPTRFVWGSFSLAAGGKFAATVENHGLLSVSTDGEAPRAVWASRRLRLLTFNAHIMEGSNLEVGAAFANERPVVFRDEERYLFMLNKVRASGADIVGFQEIWSEKHMERLMADLRQTYPFSHRGTSGPATKAGCGLVMVSRFPFKDGNFYLFPGATGDDSWASKGVLRATIEIPNSDWRISVGVAHCWTNAGGPECDNIRDIIAHTLQGDHPAVMLGDYNIHRHGDPTKFGKLTSMMTAAGATDAWATVHGPEWTEKAATDDQVNNTLAQFFSPNRNTPSPDCVDYFYCRKTASRALRPFAAEVLKDWHFPSGEGAPPWYWVHEGTSLNLPTAFALDQHLVVVTRSAGANTLQLAYFHRQTRLWVHKIISDSKNVPVEAHGSPGMCRYNNVLHLFYRKGLRVFKLESANGWDWTDPQDQGADFESSGGVCAVLYRDTIYAFVRDPTGGAVYFHVWQPRGWTKRERIGVSTLDDISAAVIGDTLCVVVKDNAGRKNKSSGVVRARLDSRNTWEISQIGNSVTCGAPGVTVRDGQFEVYFREANCDHPLSPQFGGKIHFRTSADAKTWSGERHLALKTSDAVCPVAWDNTTFLFYPYYRHTDSHEIYKDRALAHGLSPQNVALDASDHYPYQIDLVWPG